ncbi:hypothetical protein EDB80DRAFT_703443 [Ilyonectria destructans]|nr:hypothetical protein EDB80DRAFT_703443 [Ilyonectria destructans]
MILGGAAIRVKDIEQWWGARQVFTIYGPSECTPVSLINDNPSTPEDAIGIERGAGVLRGWWTMKTTTVYSHSGVSVSSYLRGLLLVMVTTTNLKRLPPHSAKPSAVTNWPASRDARGCP